MLTLAWPAALAKVALKSTFTPVEVPVKGVDAFDVQVECLGKPVSGYLGRPQNAKPKSLPAILFVHGAGVRIANLGSSHWAVHEGGMLALDINAHGIPNEKAAEFYTALNDGELKDYRSIGRQDREQCYFKGMFLRLIRAIDFLTTQPEWDGKTLIVYGSSQGGFQAFAAAGLDARLPFSVPVYPRIAITPAAPPIASAAGQRSYPATLRANPMHWPFKPRGTSIA